jgi:predicted nicotinamide N-methyase
VAKQYLMGGKMNFVGHDNYQQVYLDDQRVSGGARSNKRLRMIKWEPFKGKRVLDIGCNSGMLSIAAKKAGASYVMGIDAKPVIQVAQEVAKRENLDIDFRSMDMESDEFKTEILKGFDIVFFCAMYNHVKPDNRLKMLQLIDANTNETFFFETNFERSPEPYLEIVRKYMTFDKEAFCGLSGDRKPEDYHLYRFDRHKNEPLESFYLPYLIVPVEDVYFCNGYYKMSGEKKEREQSKVVRLKESISINGQVRPVLVVKSEKPTIKQPYSLVEGGHRYIAIKELNIPTIKIRDATEIWKAKRAEKESRG